MTASSELALPRTYLAKMIAGSSSFQTWAGTPGDATAALAKILYQDAEPDTALPIVIIASGPIGSEKIAGGTRNYTQSRGQLYLFFRDAVLRGESTTPQDVSDSADAFENNVGNVIADAKVLSGQAGYLDAERWTPDGPPPRVEYQEAKAMEAGSVWEWLWVVEFRGL